MKSLDDVFEYLDTIAKNYKEVWGVRETAPFISELVFLAHGREEGDEFKFVGEDFYTVEDLRRIKSGMAEKHMKPNALVQLHGCRVGRTSRGWQLACEVGRVFFGNKAGRIKFDTENLIPGDFQWTNPQMLKWPQCKSNPYASE